MIQSKKGGNIKKICRDHFETFVKYHGGLTKAVNLLDTGRTSKPIVSWFYGKTGTGKTRYIFDKYDPEDVWMSGENLTWFDSYMGQKIALIDDFRKDFCTFHWLLRLLDRYGVRTPVKGGFVEFKPQRIYITSAYPPQTVYDTREDIGQLLRRIDHIREFKENTILDIEGLNLSFLDN